MSGRLAIIHVKRCRALHSRQRHAAVANVPNGHVNGVAYFEYNLGRLIKSELASTTLSSTRIPVNNLNDTRGMQLITNDCILRIRMSPSGHTFSRRLSSFLLEGNGIDVRWLGIGALTGSTSGSEVLGLLRLDYENQSWRLRAFVISGKQRSLVTCGITIHHYGEKMK
ncbi:hypothetical protein Tco_1347152 [Tanacetum coccineum]